MFRSRAAFAVDNAAARIAALRPNGDRLAPETDVPVALASKGAVGQLDDVTRVDPVDRGLDGAEIPCPLGIHDVDCPCCSGHHGGDEFLVILLETNGEADTIKQRIAKRIALYNKNNRWCDFPVTLSIGSAYWNPQGSQSVDEVLNEADRLMYEDKKKHNGHAQGANHD